MQAGFRTSLVTEYLTGEYYRLVEPLVYYTEVINREIVVPVGFVTDLESVPRWFPLAYSYLGHTSRRGGAIHDYLYRRDSDPIVGRAIADAVYREICGCVGNSSVQGWLKWCGVRAGGIGSYHKRVVAWEP